MSPIDRQTKRAQKTLDGKIYRASAAGAAKNSKPGYVIHPVNMLAIKGMKETRIIDAIRAIANVRQ